VYQNATGFAPGVSQQENDRAFFVAYGQLWCEKRSIEWGEVARQTDPYFSGHWTVNGPLMNFENCRDPPMRRWYTHEPDHV
jgi:predicted metalloendopeptidase